MTTSSSRRAFLKGGTGAVIAGGALLKTDFVSAAEALESRQSSESGESPASANSSVATGIFRPAETNVPQAQYPRVDAQSRRVQFRIDAP